MSIDAGSLLKAEAQALAGRLGISYQKTKVRDLYVKILRHLKQQQYHGEAGTNMLTDPIFMAKLSKFASDRKTGTFKSKKRGLVHVLDSVNGSTIKLARKSGTLPTEICANIKFEGHSLTVIRGCSLQRVLHDVHGPVHFQRPN